LLNGDYMEIDGSQGEGGGQILRTSLAMSAVLKKPMVLKNIRAGRSKPGLQAQHLTCVNAVAEITHAQVAGGVLGSQELIFHPGPIRAGKYRFDVSDIRASAGSVSLVFQSILLPLAFAEESSDITLLGGTHVPWSPPVHYLQLVFLPNIAKMGIKAELQLKTWGFYPRGGGEVYGKIHPAKITGIDIKEPGELKRIKGISAVSNLPLEIATRQQDRALKVLKNSGFNASFQAMVAPSPGPGTGIFILTEFEKTLAGFSALGAKGKPASEVADEACKECTEFLKSDAGVDPHFADQLIPLIALAQGQSYFTTSRISLHLLTNIWVVEQFLPVKFKVDGQEGQPGYVSVDGIGYKYVS